ncbi:MAG: magnesium transporter CorA family protein [Lentisphaeria bacterium]|nr:magnesium transporter CorA family protein [Lentisphaeria bacterium]
MLHRYSVYDGRIAHSDEGTIPVDVYIMPDGEERAYLTDQLGIDEHTLASSIDPDETPRIEFEDDYIAIILKYPKNYSADDNFLFRVKSMGIFLFVDRVVLVIDEEFPQLFSGKFATKVYTKQDVLLRVLTQTIRHFESHLRVINMCSDEIETQLNESYNTSNLLDMFTLEKSLVYYVNALSGNRRAFERIRVGAYKFQFTEENIELLDDLQIENRQFLDQAQVYSQILSGLVDARSNIINNNLNVLMKNMNAIVIAVAIPTFFTGVFGMSEFTEFLSGPNHRYWYVSFPVFFVLMTGLALFVFWLIKKFEKH